MIEEKLVCATCGGKLPSWAERGIPGYFGVIQIYCSNACKQKAYRRRKKVLLHDHVVTKKKR